MPEYARGTFDGGMINACIQPNIIEGTPLYNKKKYNASHELFHIMYRELVLDKLNLPRVVWFDEGMAQLFSGQYKDELKNFDLFKQSIFSQTKCLPKLNDLSHGTAFETEEYSGYKLSFIAVKALYDKLGMDQLKSLLRDTEKVKSYGDNILKEMYEEYKEERCIDKR